MKNKQETKYEIPSMFEKNIGQYQNEVMYVLKNKGGTVFFLNTGTLFVIRKPLKQEDKNETQNSLTSTPVRPASPEELIKITDEYEYEIIKMALENANENPVIEGNKEFNCRFNYFKGSDESNWTTNVPVYGEIIYRNVYKGIDIRYYVRNGMLEHDFIVHPNGDASSIKMHFSYNCTIEEDAEGNILISKDDSVLKMLRAKAYQKINDNETEIENSYIIKDGYIEITLSDYDKSKTLIIDPPLLYSSYFGGKNNNRAYGVAVAEHGIAYITGRTNSPTDLPIKNEYESNLKGDDDAFIIKIDTTKSGDDSLLYGTFFGGERNDFGYGIAADENGIAYVTGITFSDSFPTTPNAYQDSLNGYTDAFLFKIDTTKSGTESLLYSSYLGGDNSEDGHGIALDQNKNVYITGYTDSTNYFPLKNEYQGSLNGTSDAFIIKIDTNASKKDSLLYGTYLGGDDSDYAASISVSRDGIAYLTGQTSSINYFPLKYEYQSSLHGSTDAFIVKIDTNKPGTDGLLYGTYLGGNMNEVGYGIAADENGIAYITGITYSNLDFPLKNEYQHILNGFANGFIIKIDTNRFGLDSLLYGTYLGGTSIDLCIDITINNGIAYTTGYTFSTTGCPLKNEYQGRLNGTTDAFITKIDTNKSGTDSLLYGSYLGGNASDEGNSIAIDKYQNIYITGLTFSSSEFPLKNEYRGTLYGSPDIFLTKLNISECELILEKSTCKCIAMQGEPIPFTLKVTNSGPDTASNIVVTDILDSNLKLHSYSTASGTISSSLNTVTWIIPFIPAGSSVIAMITATAAAGDIYAINTASLKSDNFILDTSITESSSMIYIAPANTGSCELILEKSSCKCSVESGDMVPFTIRVTNNGSGSASGITVTDILDSNLAFNSCSAVSGTISGTGNIVTWTIPSIPAGSSLTAVVTAIANSLVPDNTEGIYAKNTASLTTEALIADTSITESSSMIYITPANTGGCELILEKSAPDSTAKGGDTIPFTIRVTNNGPDAAANVTITDVLDSNLAFNSCSTVSGTISNKGNTMTWIIPSLPEGNSLTAVVTAIANSLVPDNNEGIYAKNTASLTSTTPLSDTSITESSSLIFINAVNASELIIDKSTCKCIAEEGDTIPFVLKVTNNGPMAASNVVVADVLDPNLTLNSFSSKTGTMSAIGNTVTWNIPEIPSGTSVYAIVTGIAGMPSTTAALYLDNGINLLSDINDSSIPFIFSNGILLESSASLTSLTPLSDSSVIESSSLVFVMPASGCELILEKSAPASTAEGGDVIPFTLKVTNNGPNAASNVIVTDILDSNLTFDSCSAVSGTINGTGNTVTWTIPTIFAGSSVVATITATAVSPPSSTAGIYAKNTATLTSSTELSSTSVTESSSLIFIKSVQILTPCDLVLNMCSSKSSYLNCENIVYKIRLKNNGPETALNISVIDSIDSRLNILSLKASSGTISNSGNILTLVIAELAPGEEAGCIIITQPNQTYFDTEIINTATASCSNGILNSYNSTSSVSIMISGIPCC